MQIREPKLETYQSGDRAPLAKDRRAPPRASHNPGVTAKTTDAAVLAIRAHDRHVHTNVDAVRRSECDCVRHECLRG
jgi:hypothetical protein